MLRLVQQAIARECLIRPGQHVLVAVSGGADSVALLHLLSRLARRGRFRLTVVHLNHRIRGAEADGDARFVQALARRLRLACVVGSADVRRQAARRGISLEMAAREARRRFFVTIARRTGADAVATAHTADDQAETVLLRLVRGSGSQGLGGMAPVTMWRNLRIIRPFLALDRREVLRYLKGQGLAWREDPSNGDTVFLRNRVRHEVLPLLEARLNPRVRPALLRTAEILREESRWLEQLTVALSARCMDAGGGLAIGRWRALPIAAQRRVLRAWLLRPGKVAPERLDFDLIERLRRFLQGREGRRVSLPGLGAVVRTRDRACMEEDRKRPGAPLVARVRVPGTTVVATAGWRIITRVGPGLTRARPRGPGALPSAASLGRIPTGALVVRSWKPGDRMAPLGLKGSRKLQDIFVDAKVPRGERHAVPVFEAEGAIAWIPGYRVARGWEVQDPAAPALQISIDRTGRNKL